MSKKASIAIAIAAVFGAAAFPAAAGRIIEFNNTTNAVYVTSNTQAWDNYATTCVNATQTPGSVDQGSGCGDSGFAKPSSDDALFFWGGNADVTTNSTVELKWTPDTASGRVQAVRLLTLKDDGGNYLQTYGPDKQAIYEAPTVPPPDGPIPPTLGWPDGDTYQRGGIWSTWGRDTVPDVANRTSSFLGSRGNQMLVNVTIGGASPISGAALTSINDFFWPGIGTPARSFDTTEPVNSSSSTQTASLTDGETVELRFFDAGSSANTDNPTAYLGDTLVQLKTGSTFAASDPAQAGILLQNTPEGADVRYERSGNDLTATVSIRAGGDGVDDATYRIFNQGGANSALAGTYSGTTINGSGITVSGDTATTVDLALAEATAERSFDATSQTLALTDINGKQATISQTISGSAATHTQDIVVNSVGPILGVNDGAATLPYGSEIDLGTIDLAIPGNLMTKTLAIANLFGDTSFSDILTDLTIASASILDGGGLFSILSAEYASSQVAGAGEALPDLEILFGPSEASSGVGLFSAFLLFNTDMNRAFGVATNEIRFGLVGRVIDSSQVPVPAPGTLALLGTGLAGVAGLRRRRRLSSGRLACSAS